MVLTTAPYPPVPAGMLPLLAPTSGPTADLVYRSSIVIGRCELNTLKTSNPPVSTESLVNR